jgi:hypothetical protein
MGLRCDIEANMKHVAGHYEGQKIVLDEEVFLPPNTTVEVVIPDTEEERAKLRKGVFLASLPALTRLWVNRKDAEYDRSQIEHLRPGKFVLENRNRQGCVSWRGF